eukprot:11894957-Alexandrium_andersonii.AAC.1
MSASLVGSEMCIRDRPSLRAFSPAQGVSPSRPATSVGVPYPVTSVGIQAVSYTHLTLPTICSV